MTIYFLENRENWKKKIISAFLGFPYFEVMSVPTRPSNLFHKHVVEHLVFWPLNSVHIQEEILGKKANFKNIFCHFRFKHKKGEKTVKIKIQLRFISKTSYHPALTFKFYKTVV